MTCDSWGLIELTSSVCIDAPHREVWARLARLEDIRLWSEAVRDARCEGARSKGVGAERTCDLARGITITERWLVWDEGRSFTYEGEGIPLVARARNTWSLDPAGEKTLLTSKAEVILRGGFLGRLFEPVARYAMRRVGSRTLAAFAHLVESGEPPPGKHAKLPRRPAVC